MVRIAGIIRAARPCSIHILNIHEHEILVGWVGLTQARAGVLARERDLPVHRMLRLPKKTLKKNLS
jgi:hypothetical protein